MSDNSLLLVVTLVGGLATIWMLEGFLLVLTLLEARGVLRPGRMELLVRSLAAVACMVFVVVSGFAFAQGQAAVARDHVPQETITFTLPVYVSSLIAAVGFTWVVARYNAKREQATEQLGHQVEAASAAIARLSAAIARLEGRAPKHPEPPTEEL